MRRVLRVLGYSLGGLFAFILLAPILAYTWLQSASGESFLRKQVIAATNDAIMGRLDLDRVSLSGLLHLELEGVRLYAPKDTEPVVSLQRAVLDVRLAALLGKRIDIGLLDLVAPRLHMVQEDKTTNLARAIESRTPPKPKEPSSGELPDIAVYAPNVHIRDAAVQIVGPSPVTVDGMNLDADLRGKIEDLDIRVGFVGEAKEPVARAAKLDLVAHYGGKDAQVKSLSLVSGDSFVKLAGGGKLDATEAELRIEEIHLAAKDVNEFVPAAKLLGDVGLSGKLNVNIPDVSSTLRLALPAKGVVMLDASAKITAPDAQGKILKYRAQVDIDHVEPHRIVAGIPPAYLKARLVAEGAGMPNEEPILVTLDAAGTRYQDLPLDRARLVAKVKGAAAHIDVLSVRAADVALDASGDVDAEKANVSAKIDVPNLAGTRARLARGLKLSLPEMSGAVHLTADVKGRYDNPKVDAKLDVPSLVIGANRVQNLKAGVQLDALRPVPRGRFTATIDHVEASGKAGDKLALSGAVDGQTATVDMTGVYDRDPVKLAVRAERLPKQKNQERWSFSTFKAEALGLKLSSTETMTVTAGGGRGSVANLRLDGGPLGRIAIDGSGGATGPIDATVSIKGLTIEQLPETVLPKELGVGGTLNLNVRATGTAKAPVADATIDIAHVRYQKMKPLDVHSVTHYDAKGVEGLVKATFQSGVATMTYKAPIVTPKAALAPGAPPAPVSVVLALDHVALENFDAFVPQPVKGDLVGTFDLSGTIQNPIVQTKIFLAQFAGYGVDKLDIGLDASYERDQLKTRLTTKRPASVEADLTFATTVAARPMLEGEQLDWRKLPVEANLVLTTLELKWLKTMGIQPNDLDGRIAGKVEVGGTAGAPRVNGTIQAVDVAASGYRGIDALLDIKAVDDLQIVASATMNSAILAELRLTAKASLEKLSQMKPEDQLNVPFTFNARLYPTPLDRLMPKQEGSTTQSQLQASVQASMSASGTANEPMLKFSSVVGDIRIGNDSPIGSFHTDLNYKDASTVFKAVLNSPVAGSMIAKATIDGSMGATALKAGSDAIKKYTVRDFGVHADNLDLGIVNGLTDSVADVGGRMSLHVDPLKPAFALGEMAKSIKAEFSMQDVKMSVLEFGSFYGMKTNVTFSGATNRLAVNEFSGRSGKGRFNVPKSSSGEAGILFEEKQPGIYGGGFAFDLDQFPVVQSYQTLAVVSLKIRTEEFATSSDLHPLAPIVINLNDSTATIGQFIFREGLVKIPASLPKAVQPLDQNPDIVFVNRPEETAKRTPEGSKWVTEIRRIIIPEPLCGTPGSPSLCGPIKIDAPLDNTLYLSTAPYAQGDQSPALVFNPARAARDQNPLALDFRLQVDGTVALLKSRFIIDRLDTGQLSYVDFKGRPVADPDLHLKAHMESGNQRVDVTLLGTAKNPQESFEANPPMADKNEILYFLATGQRQTRPQQGNSQELQGQLADAAISALGASAVGFVKDKLQSFLPEQARLDVLDINTGIAGGEAISSIGAGKRFLGGNLLVSGQYNPAARPQFFENTYELKSNYRIDQNKFLEALVGNAGRYEFKFLTQNDFCTAKQKARGLCHRCTVEDAAKGTCCEPEQARKGLCRCSERLRAAGRCRLKECFQQERSEEECACTPEAFKAGKCARFEL
jgi:hypothetical protein